MRNDPRNMKRRIITLAALLSAVVVAGCGTLGNTRLRDYELLSRAAAASQAAGDPVGQALPPQIEGLPGQIGLGEAISLALAQNPEIRAGRAEVLSLAQRVPQASSLEDPMLQLNVAAEPIQTAAGQQELTLMAGQKVPWRGKLSLKAAAAEAEVEAARARLSAAELDVIEQVKRAYYELHFAQSVLKVLNEDAGFLDHIVQVSLGKLRAGRLPQEDVYRIQIERAMLENEIIRQREQLLAARSRLSRLLHLSPESELVAAESLPEFIPPDDAGPLYRQAVAARPELQAQLATIERDRLAAELARLGYLPDPTFSATWVDISSAGISGVRNGRDAVMLGVGMNLPVYRGRLEGAIREAEARAVASARRYDAQRDRTLEDVKSLLAAAQSRYEMGIILRRDMLGSAEKAVRISLRSLEVAEVDFLDLLDDWRRLFRLQIALLRADLELRQALASLERVVGCPLVLQAAGAPSEPIFPPMTEEAP